MADNKNPNWGGARAGSERGEHQTKNNG